MRVSSFEASFPAVVALNTIKIRNLSKSSPIINDKIMAGVQKLSGDATDNLTYSVFVYGTLRKGGSNHRLMESADFCNTTRIPGYEMWSLGPFPAVVPVSGIPADPPYIVAELYRVDAALLARLDLLEDYYGPDHPRNLYERKWIIAPDGSAGYLYVFVADRLLQKPFRHRKRLIRSGDWFAKTQA